MRGSGVVQSLKSWASKLHPQLPLSPKESQRLLAALTSSFRQQLDEAHPRQALEEDVRPRSRIGHPLTSGGNAFHTSSVAFADRHLASVLTNPLLSKQTSSEKPTLDYESAKRELERDTTRDPISLLEEYHEKGAATIQIADLCLRTFRDSLVPLSAEQRRETVSKYCAGVRTLHWLWESELYAIDTFPDERKLISAMVRQITEEGKEQFLWGWLALDMPLGRQTTGPEGQVTHNPNIRYRWKDFTLRMLVMDKFDQHKPGTLNDALDVYFRAVDLRQDMTRNSQTNFMPLSWTISALTASIFQLRRQKQSWDPKRYDRFVETVHLSDHIYNHDWTAYNKALLALTHPRSPSPVPIFNSVKESYLAEPSSPKAEIWKSFSKDRRAHPIGAKIQSKKYYTLLETARQLQARGYEKDADWVVSQMRLLYPERLASIDKDLSTGGQPKKIQTVRVFSHNISPHAFTGPAVT